MYGVEIWGWKEYAEMEAVQEKYLGWMLGLRKETPGYIVREECKREKLRVYTGKRAVKYDERLKEREECRILYKCWKEKKEAGKEHHKGRQGYYERLGYAWIEIEEREKWG
ncbi:hypothetical protein Zmor_024476 [Zophobas morio]|uniref:Uncharacterized protein n=1 Tax=Zophobas morio TaxID=2755281 RepID=A0AA38I387_9CUCU|nr:hypothetical protein Zmor_024476 [Zophobas morio]